ncbi:MAG: ABC transporter permease, partial [Ilumatobacteraceae bacterium]
MRFALQRVGMALILLLTISALTFGAMNLLGDPLFNILGPAAGDLDNPKAVEQIEAAKEQYNLDEPLPVRWVLWLFDFVTGDFGVQFSTDGQPPVRDLIAERLPRTMMLVILAQLMAVTLAVPWALISAARVDKPVDRISTMTAFLFVAIPNFALAVILKYLLAVRWEVFPQAFVASDPFWTRMYQMFLPALTIALPAAAVYQRLLRTDLITTLQEDFILTARAKGVSRPAVLFKHALRPSLFSFITIFAINTGALIGGALIVETIFLIPGLGTAIVEAILREDFPVVLAIVVIISITFVLLTPL